MINCVYIFYMPLGKLDWGAFNILFSGDIYYLASILLYLHLCYAIYLISIESYAKILTSHCCNSSAWKEFNLILPCVFGDWLILSYFIWKFSSYVIVLNSSSNMLVFSNHYAPWIFASKDWWSCRWTWRQHRESCFWWCPIWLR